MTLKLPNNPATVTMTQMTGSSCSVQNGVAIDGEAGAPKADSERPAPMNFEPGQQSRTFSLTAGIVTMMNFTH
ncbi:hypothetical protein [Arthrobacter psychrochitiniphilus]|uniref:Uncharacterized protein n=1 Tax=Arthrobacter psychrochitiniphilus TaxID=291045 RepID=A0A2V3DPE2_9MICC|nr:hypothetical protein [Arthrobacter psychrochitiniphilus]NYG18062.1 hypothetical protein [Arthrobacter psychrochitiniphilus]PXA64216.1 hypothetical protein CVS29_16460 [Arthrobacter psychrochitiniphilus]